MVRNEVMDVNEKIVMRAGIYSLFVFSIISLTVYATLYYGNVGNYISLVNSGIDTLFFIPIYSIIVVLFFSYKRGLNDDI